MSTKKEDYFRILLISQPLKRINLREISNKEYLEDIFSISHQRSLMALLKLYAAAARITFRTRVKYSFLYKKYENILMTSVYTIWNNANVC